MPGNTALRTRNGKNIVVETISLNQLIEEEFKGEAPSYISIDTEGSEFEILNSFDFSKYQPPVFTIEHNFTDFQKKIDILMFKNGYCRDFDNFLLISIPKRIPYRISVVKLSVLISFCAQILTQNNRK